MDYRKNLKLVYHYANKSDLVKIVLISGLVAIFGVINPWLTGKIIGSLNPDNFNQLIQWIIVGAIGYPTWSVIKYHLDQKVIFISNQMTVGIRADLIRDIIRLSNKAVENESSGTYLERFQDAENISRMFCRLNFMSLRAATKILVFAAIFYTQWQIGCYLLFLTALGIMIHSRGVKASLPLDQQDREARDKMIGFFKEIVNGLRDVKMFGNDPYIIDCFDKAVTSQGDKYIKLYSTMNRYHMYADSLYDFTWVSAVFLIGVLCTVKTIAIDQAITLFFYLDYIGGLNSIFSDISEHFGKLNISLKRIIDIFDDEVFPKEKFGNTKLENLHGNISMSHVAFSYDASSPILQDISCEIKAGSSIAFIGPSGVGKSTILSLLCRMYDSDKGSILLDGYPIQSLDKDTIRKNIALISQSPAVFNKSIIDSFRDTKPNITMKEVIDVCKKVKLDDWIASLKNGYNSVIGENGINMSGGQRQRLAIARALVKEAKILLFDEATSALDSKTQNEIKKLIESLKGKHTVVIIAHRLCTIKNCDNIMLVNDGKIVDQGTYHQLRSSSKLFRELYQDEFDESSISDDKLANLEKEIAKRL